MIEDDRALAELVTRVKSAAWIAIDTEADSLHSYPENLCLLQLSLPGLDELVDPLAKLDLAPLLGALGTRELILHGGDYDLRLMRRSWDFVPQAVFDTMLAARLLGLLEFSLTSLVSKYLGLTLEKGPQKANWGRRPLTDRMKEYARNDTRYLKPLSDRLREELDQKGRLPWQREACDRLIKECAQSRPRDPNLVWRIKGSERLSRRGLAVLRELWRWREREAQHSNKPPYFVLSHEALTELSEKALTQSVESLLPGHWSPRRRLGLGQAVRRGVALPPEKQPDFPHTATRRFSEAEKRRLHDLKQRRDRRAAELGLDPALIASRATLASLARDWKAHARELMQWQRDLLGD